MNIQLAIGLLVVDTVDTDFWVRNLPKCVSSTHEGVKAIHHRIEMLFQGAIWEFNADMTTSKIGKGGFPKSPIACQDLLQMLILFHKQVNP